MRRLSLTLSVLGLLCLLAAAVAAAERGRLVGGSSYALPGWFKQSFLELADDASEAAEADKHVLLFMHLDGCPYCDAVLRESLVGADYSAWLRQRFDVIAINVRGSREVAFDATTRVSEKQLAELLKVRQTPALIFLDGANRQVLRLDGYRTPRDLKYALDYVDSKSYLKGSLPDFIARTAAGPHYTPRSHPAIRELTDLTRTDKPLLVLFEDAFCSACDLLHDTLFTDAEVNDLLEQLTVVRLDAESEAPLVDPAGRRTTAKAWSRELELLARPSLLLFAGGEERVRIAGVLRHFHFVTALRYVTNREYTRYPSLRDYSAAYTQQLFDAGIDIDVGR